MDLRLNKVPWYGQVGLFVAIALGGVAAFYYLYAEPARASLAEQHQRLEAMRAEINRGLATARKLPVFRSEVADLESRLESLRAVLPDQKDFGDVLRSLQSLATQSNLTIRTFKPGAVVTKQLHAEWPFHMELDGGYHDLALFFDRVSKSSRLTNVASFSVKANDRAESSSTVSVSCVITTFVLLDAIKTPVQPGAPAGAATR
jgi:type IV pilus assembly protein PilO